jgi:hypothetical protein
MLPKIEHPIHTIQIPSTHKKHNFRPFLVKEEKLLLMAKESGEESDILRAIKQIVNNCCIDDKFRVDDISATDLAFLFIRLRAISVNNKIKQTYLDPDDNKTYTVEIDLDQVKVHQDKVVSNIIKISKNMGIVMRYPPAQVVDDDSDDSDLFLIRSIDKIYEDDDIHLPKDYKKKELIEFIEHLPINVLEAMNEFINNSPTLLYVAKYTNSLGTEREITLRALTDFFIFR